MVIFLSETRSSLCIDTTLLQLQPHTSYLQIGPVGVFGLDRHLMEPLKGNTDRKRADSENSDFFAFCICFLLFFLAFFAVLFYSEYQTGRVHLSKIRK